MSAVWEDTHPVQFGEQCPRPKPQTVRWQHPFDYPDGPTYTSIICRDCAWTLRLLEYEQGGQRMRWWRHAHPPVAIG